MTEPLRVFIGYDSKEPAAYHVLAHSILARATFPVSITPLVQGALRKQGIYTRERGPTESTEFSLTRFLVPYLSHWEGYSVFMDSDMLCRVDIGELWPVILEQLFWGEGNYPKRARMPFSEKALLCCQHDYTPTEGRKFLGNPQTIYPRKNWSSVMVFANDRCRRLTPAYVNRASGLELHRFQWLKDEEIASLPLEWNWLVGEYQANSAAKILHWTLGGPWFPGYSLGYHAGEWFAERDLAFGLPTAATA